MKNKYFLCVLLIPLLFALFGCGGGAGGNEAYYSWTLVPEDIFSGDYIKAVVWGKDRFVAVTGTQIAYSYDGISWTLVTATPFVGADKINSITWGDPEGQEKFVAVGQGYEASVGWVYRIWYSENGITWTQVADSFVDINGDSGLTELYGIAWGGGKFVTVGQISGTSLSHYNPIGFSDDGIIWEGRSISGWSQLWGVAWGNNRFVAFGNTGIAWSGNGSTWNTVTVPVITPKCIAWGNGKFIAGADASYDTVYSDDGESWTKVNGMSYGYPIYAIAWGNDRFVAVGGDTFQHWSHIYYSHDGINWTLDTSNPFNTDGTSGLMGIAYGGPPGKEKFVAVGSNGGIMYSTFSYR